MKKAYIVFETVVGNWFAGHFIQHFSRDCTEKKVVDVTSRSVQRYALVLEVSGMDMSATNLALTRICKKMDVDCTSGVYSSYDVTLTDSDVTEVPVSLPGTHHWLDGSQK